MVADEKQFIEASQGADKIREKYGYGETDKFKFSTNSRPKHMDFHKWTASKIEALELIDELEIKFLVLCVHHKIANPLKRPEGVTWNMQNLFRHYSRTFLQSEPGAVCLDRVDEKWSYNEIAKIAQSQIEFRDKTIGIPQIIHYSFTDSRFSSFNSLVDIALGTFHYCCESAFADNKAERAMNVRAMLSLLYPCFARVGEDDLATGAGLLMHPKNPSFLYKKDYDRLYAFLSENKPK
ncbi:hypothetical protein CpMRi49_01575 [Corynebacterium ulcerans]|uniref:hypothetical protein n=1 Tax=Corynebacterium ulcerans TaxID=65058 RepID=UPI00130349FF|nr:hypothetical protein [Corynebacterium ulcerans]MBL4943512.1 hypothetical protein [Corynebacterium ulcerans]QGZ24718.1 hypothetical protein CpMRi49_01575 [Corynebacterium ulcerans]QOE23431.1 hypothetical protein HUF05_01880 [Corynebacterium ulcerans]